MDISSLIFIIGYLVNILATAYLIYTVKSDKHIEGLSFQTQIIYAVATITKIFYFFATTLSEYFIGYVEIVLSFATSVYLIYTFWKYRKLSIGVETNFTFTAIAVPSCIVLSIFVHPGFIQDGFDFASMMIATSVSITYSNIQLAWLNFIYPNFSKKKPIFSIEYNF